MFFARKAKDISGSAWFNISSLPATAAERVKAGDDLRIDEDLAGFVVLIIFWDYSCMNCIRVMPHLRSWWEQYEKQQFLIIGVHTPEFQYGREADSVESAVLRFHLDFPVVSDSEYTTWDRYNNSVWPHMYLADRKGKIRFDREGEGAHKEIELKINQLLASS